MFSARGWSLRLVAAATIGGSLLLAACQATTPPATAHGPSARPAARAQGLTDYSMRVTLFAGGDQSKAGKAYGPVRQALERIVDRTNVLGGIAHRMVEPRWALDALSGDEQSADVELNEVCATGVGEQASFAVQATDHGGGLGRLKRAACVGSGRGVTFVPDRLVNALDLDDVPGVVAPYAMEDFVAAAVLVERLAVEGFFDGGGELAILDPGREFSPAIATNMERALQDAADIFDPLIITDKVDTQAQIDRLVGRLVSEGVDRVIYFDDAPTMSGVVRAMVAQKFTPPLGLVANAQSNSVISTLNYPARQVYAVSTVGAYPTTNGTRTSLPDYDVTKECLTAKDVDTLGLDGPRISVVLEACDMLALINTVIDADGTKPTTASFYDGLAKVSNFESAYGTTLDFSLNRIGATQVWDLRGDPICRCLKVVSRSHSVSID